MEGAFLKYLNSYWLYWINIPIFILFGLMAYNAYAKRWSAITGKHSTKGKITWSGKIPGGKPPYLVSYSYYVNGVLYNSQLRISPFRADKIIKENPRGKEITVYYANKDPGFSNAFKPPMNYQIIGSTIIQYLILPLVFINAIFSFIFWLLNAAK